MKPELMWDVIILGSGLSGAVLGACLARNGVRVLLLDKGCHPKFTIGESTIPETSLQFSILADRYGVPELKNLASFHSFKNVMTTSGIKTNFGFVYHREGAAAKLSEMNQSGPLAELHLFRQDVDAYLFQVALKYGCDARQAVPIKDVRVEDDGVTVVLGDGTVARAEYLVDGTGHDSVIAKQFGLREGAPRTRTHSWTTFTHMIGVEPYDKQLVGLGPKGAMPPEPFHRGTLHHIVPEGWMWVIPMDNHGFSTNPVCSVGITLDPRLAPDDGSPPDEVFRRFVERYPDIRRQFMHALPVRPWVKTGRLQYSSRKCVGDRYCLLSHATGFIDALFSRGLANTTRVVNLLAALLIEAARTREFGAAAFAELEAYQQTLIDDNDRLVHGAFVSFRDYSLWNAWFRVWMMYALANYTGTFNRYMSHLESGDPKDLWRAGHSPELGFRDPKVSEFLHAASDALYALERGETTNEQAERALYELIDGAEFALPVFPFSDQEAKFQRMDRATFVNMARYTMKEAPDEFRKLYCERGFFHQLGTMQRFRGHDPRTRVGAALRERLASIAR